MASVKKPWMGLNDVKEQELDVVARPLKDNGDGSYTPLLPAGYAGVTSGQAPLDPDYVEANRGSWANADNAYMSDEDWNLVQQYKQDYANATTDAERQAAHKAAEDIRMNKYGYAGGVDGSEYNPTMVYVGDGGGLQGVHNMDNGDYGEFDYNNAGKYVSRWQSQIDALTGAILGRDPFNYDKNKDPLYQQYKESYTRGGQRGMQDTLAQVAARTGGMASSYAESAAQQTYNNYMAALADKVPELQQLAYSMYMDDIAMDRADLDMLMGLDSTDYGRWSDDRNFNYGAYRDSVADQQWKDSFAYQQAQDALAQKNWQSQFDYQMAQDALAQQNWQTQWDYNVLQDELARQDALAKLYAKGSGTGTEPTGSVWGAISGMGDEIQVYEYLMGNVKNQDDREYFLSKWMEQQEMANDSTPGLVSGEVNLSDTRGTNYQETNDHLKQMRQEGYSTEDIRAFINKAYNQGVLTPTDYQRLINQYR